MSTRLTDKQVDLCGELGHAEEDDFPPIGLEDEFGFSCRGCGGCCKGREDIVLSGFDLYRLCKRLQLPPQVVINGYCRLYTGSISRMPVVRLEPRADDDNCPFLWQNRCTVHDAKPLVCALYPLGQTIELNGNITYFVQDTGCGGPRLQFRLKDYLDSFGIRDREALDLQWARLNLGLSKRLRTAAERQNVSKLALKVARRRIAHALYLDYDFQKPYEEQLAQNLRSLQKDLTRYLKDAATEFASLGIEVLYE